ncbi:MAG TPA: DUF6443 domain-containing protein [Mucilaginibacter sp.]
MKRQYRNYLLSLILLLAAIKGYAQVPGISYTNTQTIVAGTTITPIAPTNSGGAVAVNGQTALLAGSVGLAGSQDGSGGTARFSNPIGMAVDSVGNIYVTDEGNYKIRKITPAGVVTTFAGTGGAGANNGLAAQATFNGPFGLCFDRAGNMYVADYFNNMIRKITPSGIVSTLAGSGTKGYVNGPSGTAQFNNPTGVAADALGNVYVADYGNRMIRKITPDGTVSLVAGQTTAGYNDAQGALAQFNGPQTLAFDPQGNLIVVDKANNMIRKITPNATVSTLAGQLTAGYSNGTGGAAQFSYPAGIAIDPAGNIYVPDYNNNCIRVISPLGVVTTLSGTTVAGSNNAAGSTTTFNNPYGIAIDKSGSLYVSDFTNETIRKVLSTPYTISPALPVGLNFNTTTGVISGAAISSSPSTTYTITAYNLSGSGTATLTFAVNAASVAPSQNMNYIMTYVPRVSGLTTSTAVVNASTDKTRVQASIQYLDGLDRPLQTVQVKGSPNGRDVVQPFIYDSQGRDSVKYLPYAVTGSAGSDGSYKTDALTAGTGVFSFYNPTGTGTSGNQQNNGIVVNPNPYSQTIFEPSSLNRVTEQGAPGTPWQPVPNSTTGHTVKMVYTLNNSYAFSADSVNGRQVAWYNATINADGSRSLVANGFYPANTITVTVTEDENWTSKRAGTTEEYKDIEGHVLLKRQYNYTTSLQVLSTYYVYDDFDKLAFVLPPMSGADAGTTISQTTLNNLCYQYRYDERGRLTQKKLPGKGWEYTVYNYIDQPVATQDSLQRAANNWIITKYDGIGRAIETGIWNASLSRSSLQGTLTGIITNLWESPVATGNGYTNVAWPTTALAATLDLNYYDSYANIPGLPATYSSPTGASVQTRGLAVAKKTAVLNTPTDQLWSVTYYDDLGRAIKSYAQHYLGGTANTGNYDAISTSYNFTNVATATTRQHFTTGSTTVPLLTATNTYMYDHMGRKVKTWEQLTYGSYLPTGNTLISQADYNEIGQVMTKHLHSTDSVSFLQNISYSYNERGWMLGSISPLFAMSLYYNTSAGNKMWNGNIMYQYWGTQGNQNSHYAYAYDKLNRLIAGSSTANNNEYPAYDQHGNIIALNRGTGTTYAAFDQLTYNYTLSGNPTNQVQSIADANTSNTGLVSGTTSYTYDGNGNMLIQNNGTNNQQNKTFTYNLLNLPQTVVAHTGITTTSTLTYTYDAAGNKLRRTSTGLSNTTDYITGIQYDGTTTPALNFIQTEEGKAVYQASTGGFEYEYYLGDNLGNTRVTFGTKTGTAAVYQTDDYYPFGMEVNSYTNYPKNEYLYNKKELQEELGQYDYGARFYDPVIGRWNVVDAYAEHPDQIDLSPYAYVGNNPITRTDPDGNCPPCEVPDEENDFLRYSNQADKNQDYTKAIIHDASVGILDVIGVRDLVRAVEHLGDKNVSTTQKVTRVVVAAVNVMPIDGEGERTGQGPKIKLEEPKIDVAYKRPNNATTPEQRASVQDKPCATCGATGGKRIADHKKPLVQEHYETGKIDKKKMHDVNSVQPQCPTCSAKQGAEMSKYSKKQKRANGL